MQKHPYPNLSILGAFIVAVALIICGLNSCGTKANPTTWTGTLADTVWVHSEDEAFSRIYTEWAVNNALCEGSLAELRIDGGTIEGERRFRPRIEGYRIRAQEMFDWIAGRMSRLAANDRRKCCVFWFTVNGSKVYVQWPEMPEFPGQYRAQSPVFNPEPPAK